MRYLIPILSACLILMSCEKIDDDCDKPSSCQLEPDAGQCEAYMPRYFYNSASGKCEEFIWGGCGGAVPFETLEACYECECDKRLE